MSKSKSADAKPRRFLRENIEAIATAIIVALLFKVFILEISRIPSGSMQPTLMGDPQSGLFDRVLVDKFSFKMREPERFEIVVFKHPLERSRIMVKRLVGMPGEEFKVEAGDLWTRGTPTQDWTILRRSDVVMDEMWKRLDRAEFGATEWSQIVGRGWQFEPGAILASGSGKARFRAEQGTPIQNAYYDGYPAEIRKSARGQSKKRAAVGDVRLSGSLRASADAEAFVIEIQEGRNAYAFRLPGPAASADATASIETRVGGEADRIEGPAFRLAANETVDVTAINLDDRVALLVDGKELLAAEVPSVRDGGAFLTVEFVEGGGRFEQIAIERDVYYLTMDNRQAWKVEIPEGQYVMLGDNTQDSADSRDWTAQRYDFEREGEQLSYRGNFRSRENPRFGQDASGRGVTGFRNEWGDLYWFSNKTGVGGLQHSAPLVPRELIVGRALAVFWPLHRGRFTWLH
ncbi:MAG: signal peptidase I [Planctomycetota bacterium]